MKKIFDIHDASIVKLEYSLKENKLVVGIILENTKEHDLIFKSVVGFDFSPYESQNFLLDFRIHEYSELSNFFIDNYEVNPRYLEIMKETSAYLFEFDPAVGLGGYVIAKDLVISPEPD